MAHSGSWNLFGYQLPDFGITEAAGRLFGSGTTSQGGSNLTGPDAYRASNQIIQQPQTPPPQDMSSEWAGATGQTYINPNPTPTGEVKGTTDTNNGTGESQTNILDEGYNTYLGQLDQMLGTLGNTQTSMVGTANEQYNQNLNNLDLQNTQGENTLNQYQNKSLKDIGSTIGAGFRAGNILLGSMGAGNSSSANQYAAALAREGSKQRGNVMADVSNRMGQLKQVYNTAKTNLTSSLQQKIQEISTWFSQQQMQLQGLKADAAKERSTQLLQLATNALSVAQQQASGMQNALNTWVANNATSIQSATQQIQQNVANNPIPTTLNTSPQASIGATAPIAYANGANMSTEKNKLFPNYNYLG